MPSSASVADGDHSLSLPDRTAGRASGSAPECAAPISPRLGAQLPGTAASEDDVRWARFCAYLERLDDYLPGRFDGPVVLFRSSHLDDKPPGGDSAGWNRFAPASARATARAGIPSHRLL